MKKSLLLLVTICFVTFYACKDDEEDPVKTDDPVEVSFCDSVAATYDKDIASIFNSNCATSGCHEDKSTAPKGIKLANYDQVKAATGFPAFMKSIKHEAGATAMPVGKAKLSDTTIAIIQCWIDGGLKEN